MDLSTPSKHPAPEQGPVDSPQAKKPRLGSAFESPNKDTSSPITVGTEDAVTISSDTPTPAPAGPVRVADSQANGKTPVTDSPSNSSKSASTSNALFQTIIKLEYGKDFDSSSHVPLEFLCKHSPKLAKLFLDAEPLCEIYRQMGTIRKEVKRLSETPKVWDEKNVQATVTTARSLIHHCLCELPMKAYQEGLLHALANTTALYFKDSSMFKAPDTPHAVADYPPKAVVNRLKLLKYHATHAVTERLNKALSNIKREEHRKAESSPLKAAAQRRILLPATDAETVGSLLRWVYEQTLSFRDAEHLCRVYELASELGMTSLASICTEELYTATSYTIDQGKNHGVTLRDFLEKAAASDDSNIDKASPDDLYSDPGLVGTVFQFVITHREDPPQQLKELVVSHLVACGDANMVIEEIAPEMNEGMKLLLVKQLFRQLEWVGLRETVARETIEGGRAESFTAEGSPVVEAKPEMEKSEEGWM